MGRNIWGREVSSRAPLLIAALLLGYWSGHILLAMVLLLLIYLASQTWHARRLIDWLQANTGEYPPSGGGAAWDEIGYQIHLLRQRNNQRKQRLATAISRFRSAFDALPDATVVLNAAGQIEWFNPAAQRLLGLKTGDVGRPLLGLVRHPQLAEFMQEPTARETVGIPSPVQSGVSLDIRRVPYGEDMSLLIAQDVTKIKFMERVRTDFVANVSHELRTPLTVTKGYLETLNDSLASSDPLHGRILQRLSEQNERMCRLVDDLLTLARVEAAPSVAAFDPVDVAGLLRGISEDADAAHGRHARINLEILSRGQLLGETRDLVSVFSNLLNNALRHTGADGAVTLTWRDTDEGGACLEVHDTGEGIPEEHLARLTERFYRVDATPWSGLSSGAHERTTGTGLGLSIVRHALARHEAELKIDSRLGQGSTFRCSFPNGRIRREPDMHLS